MTLTSALFVLLVLATVLDRRGRAELRAKPWQDWVLDLSNLFVQGTLIPILQVVLVARIAAWAWPGGAGVLALGPVAAALLNLLVVDYAYYWNHRLLHVERLWPIHRVHHTVTSMDVFASSRNPLWGSLLICYVWVNGLLVHLLADATGFVWAAALTAGLDLWRHSRFDPPEAVASYLRPWLILPSDHAAHHARTGPHGNYGANFKLWDRLHGTTVAPARPDTPLGVPTSLSLSRSLLWPFP